MSDRSKVPGWPSGKHCRGLLVIVEGKKSLLLNQTHTKSFTLLKCSPHGCTGGAVTITNPTAILDSAGLNHLVTAYLLKRTSKTENSTIYYLYFI